jgi:hypothetical protein
MNQPVTYVNEDPNGIPVSAKILAGAFERAAAARPDLADGSWWPLFLAAADDLDATVRRLAELHAPQAVAHRIDVALGATDASIEYWRAQAILLPPNSAGHAYNTGRAEEAELIASRLRTVLGRT